MKLFLILSLILVTGDSHAAFFSPKNYEECLSDLVKSNNNLNSVRQVCRERFPKLEKLTQKKKVTLFCKDIEDTKSTYKFVFDKNKIKSMELTSVAFDIKTLTKSLFLFEGVTSEKTSNRKVKIIGDIKPISGFGSLTLEYQDKKDADVIYRFICDEE